MAGNLAKPRDPTCGEINQGELAAKRIRDQQSIAAGQWDLSAGGERQIKHPSDRYRRSKVNER
jgi:hypothetical protein